MSAILPTIESTTATVRSDRGVQVVNGRRLRLLARVGLVVVVAAGCASRAKTESDNVEPEPVDSPHASTPQSKPVEPKPNDQPTTLPPLEFDRSRGPEQFGDQIGRQIPDLEARFAAEMARAPESWPVEIAAQQAVLTKEFSRSKAISDAYEALRADATQTSSIRDLASFRIMQLRVRLFCWGESVPPPPGLTEEQFRIYQEQLEGPDYGFEHLQSAELSPHVTRWMQSQVELPGYEFCALPYWTPAYD